MTTYSNIAVSEMERLRKAHAWSPVAKPTRRLRNQHVTIYWFADGSRLGVYHNGDASWFHRTPEGHTSGEQRWRGWHYCYSAS